jgi:myosin heavy subunit
MAQINPFQSPINYSVDVQSPFEAALGGFKVGQAGAEMQAQAQARERKQQFQTGLNDFFKKPDRTYEDLEKLLPFADKQQFDALTKVGEGMDKRRLDTDKRVAAQTLIALEQNPSIAKTMLQERFDAETDPNQKRALGVLIETVDVDPKRAAQMIELTGAATFGKDWYSGITANRQERRAEALQPSAMTKAQADANAAVADAEKKVAEAKDTPARLAAEQEKRIADANKAKVDAQFAGPLAQASLNLNAAQIKNINSEISNRAANTNLNQQTMQATVAEKLSNIQKNLNELPADTRKLVNESAVTAAASKQSADQYNDLAKRLEAAGGGYGVFSNASELVKKGLGLQGGMSQLRQEYTRMRNSAAVKSLPPGPATDKDIELALKPFPSDTADAKYMASFLRGMAKLQDIEAAVSNAKTDWLANNNGVLTRARNTFQAGDYATKPGESFNDFTQRVVQDQSKRYSPAAQTPLVEQIPTDRTPRPAAPAANIRSQADAILRGGQ